MSKQTVKEVLESVDKRYKDRRYWTQGYWAKDSYEHPVEYDDYSACCWCFAGIIHKETGHDIEAYLETAEYVGRHLIETEREKHFDGEDWDSVIMFWNDTEGITFAEIKEVLHECIEELGK